MTRAANGRKADQDGWIFIPTAVDHASEAFALLPARRLGALLQARRQEAHIDAPAVARAAGIEITTLDDIEAGRTPPRATVLVALLTCYGVAPDEFVPPRATLAATSADANDDDILRDYVDSVRTWRKAGRTDKLSFRASDLLALGNVLGTDPDDVERRLIAATACSPTEARLLRK